MTFTRSRAYRKNDGCHVEQKNWSVVRQNVGYARFDTPEELEVLSEIHALVRLHTNFFMPSAKLVSKTRDGSKITKRYDKPTTPYRRVLARDDVDEKTKTALTAQFETLNPAGLRRWRRLTSSTFIVRQRISLSSTFYSEALRPSRCPCRPRRRRVPGAQERRAGDTGHTKGRICYRPLMSRPPSCR